MLSIVELVLTNYNACQLNKNELAKFFKTGDGKLQDHLRAACTLNTILLLALMACINLCALIFNFTYEKLLVICLVCDFHKVSPPVLGPRGSRHDEPIPYPLHRQCVLKGHRTIMQSINRSLTQAIDQSINFRGHLECL